MHYLKSFLTAGCIAAMVWGLSGCKEDDPAEVALQSINVTPATVSVVEGATQQLTVTLVPEGVTGVTVSYQSASTVTATVSTSGLVRGVAAGATTVTVTAATQNGTPVTKAVPVTVTAADVPLESISVEPTAVALVLGTDAATQQLTITTVPAGLPGVTYTYVPEHTNIATVSETGLVTAVAVGATTITVTATAPVGSPVTKAVPVTVDYAIDDNFNRNAWTGEASSILGDGAEAIRMFDGDLTSIWHSNNPGIPATFTVDMKGNKRIDGFYYYHRQDVVGADRQYPKDLTVETSMNGEDWTTVYTATEAVMKKLRVALPLQSQVIARYFKVTITSTAFDQPYTYFAEFGAYNEAEPLPTPVNIALNAPAAEVSHSAADPLTFTWEVDDPAPANYTLKISKNADLSNATEFTAAGTSKQVSTADLATILGGEGMFPIYWTVSAAGATSPEARPLTLIAQLVPVTLVNAAPTFQSVDIEVPWVDGQHYKRLAGWTHNEAAFISLNTLDNQIAMFSYPVASIGYVTNGKVYQAVSLQAGYHELTFHCLGIDGNSGVEAYGVVTKANELPDYNAVTTDGDVVGSIYLPDYQNRDAVIKFTLTEPATVQLGWVYNTSETTHGHQSFKISSIELNKAN
jgi:hypothetical protein